jgi:hypothetical protein
MSSPVNPLSDRGVAVIAALLATVLIAALGTALVLTASTESLIAANFRNGVEARYAADAIAERVLVELLGASNWNDWLTGTTRSAFVDTHPVGVRTLPDGTAINLPHIVNSANCGKPIACTAADLNAVTADRPWGPNNPRWQLAAYGYLRDVGGVGLVPSDFFVVAMVADDASENDGDPLLDGAAGNPGAGVVGLRAEAFGPRGSRKAVEVTLARSGAAMFPSPFPVAGRLGVRILAWREVG